MGRKPNLNAVEKKPKNKKEFIEDPSLITLANKVITENRLDYLNQVRIRYVLVDQYISKTVIGKCVRANKELKHFAQMDYIIEISKDVWDKIDDQSKEIIMLHELLHVLLAINKDGDLVTKIFDHDVKDFSTIIKKYSIDALKELRIAVTSIRDMELAQSDNIKV